MLIIFDNTTLRNSAVKVSELSQKSLSRVIENCGVQTYPCFDFDNAIEMAMYCALDKFRVRFEKQYKHAPEQHLGHSLGLGLKYNFSNDNHGWQIIIDIDKVCVCYQNLLAEYFTWDSMTINNETTLEDFLRY